MLLRKLIRRVTTRHALVVGAVTTVVAVSAGIMPADAFNGSLPQACGVNWDMTCTGAAQAVQDGSDSQLEVMAYTCAAVAPVTLSTTVSTGISCYFVDAAGTHYTAFEGDRSTNISQLWVNGPVANLTGQLTMHVKPYQLCVEGGYFNSGILTPIGGPACSQLNL